MTAAPRIAILPLGMSLGLFFVVTYLLCLLFGLALPAQGMHRLFPALFPGFVWLTWPSVLLGLVWAFAYGWYIAVIFAPLHNFFAAWSNGHDKQ